MFRFKAGLIKSTAIIKENKIVYVYACVYACLHTCMYVHFIMIIF